MTTARKSPKIINGVAVDDLFTTINAVKATPVIAKFTFRIHNQWEGAGQNSSTVDKFRGAGQELSRPQPFVLKADEPPVLLGKDMGANPVEHLLHSLAACLTTSMVYHAAARGIEIEEVESSLEGDLDLRGFLGLDKTVRKGYQGIRVNFKVKADVPDDQLQEILQLGPQSSPVFDSLTNGVPVSVTGERMSSIPREHLQYPLRSPTTGRLTIDATARYLSTNHDTVLFRRTRVSKKTRAQC